MSIELAQYRAMQELLESQNFDLSPAEIQGMQWGVLCGGEDADIEHLYEIVLKELAELHHPAENLTDQIRALFDELIHFIENDMESEEDPELLNFPLYIPEQLPLNEQANELSCWCRGFLYGLSLSSVNMQRLQSTEGKEMFNDISETAKLPPLQGDAPESEDAEYVRSIFEYLQIAAMMMYWELLTDLDGEAEDLLSVH